MYAAHLVFPSIHRWTFRLLHLLAVVIDASMNMGVQIALQDAEFLFHFVVWAVLGYWGLNQ
jgi:hypothetical protein